MSDQAYIKESVEQTVEGICIFIYYLLFILIW